MAWRDTAMRLAKEALSLYGDDDARVIKYIEEKTKETVLVLVNEHEDSIGFDETIDDVIARLAYWIVREKALDYYIQLLQKENGEE